MVGKMSAKAHLHLRIPNQFRAEDKTGGLIILNFQLRSMQDAGCRVIAGEIHN